jgi:hypothetical protein
MTGSSRDASIDPLSNSGVSMAPPSTLFDLHPADPDKIRENLAKSTVIRITKTLSPRS